MLVLFGVTAGTPPIRTPVTGTTTDPTPCYLSPVILLVQIVLSPLQSPSIAVIKGNAVDMLTLVTVFGDTVTS
jgi:hypothetical protein